MNLLQELEIYAQRPTRKRMQGMSDKTYSILKQNLRDYLALYQQVNRQTFEKFLTLKVCSSGTRFYLAHCLGKFLEAMGYITDSEYYRIKKAFPRGAYKKKEDYLTDTDVEKFISYVYNKKTLVSLRDTIICYIMATTGARVSQVIELERADVQLKPEGWEFSFNRKKQSINSTENKHKLTIGFDKQIGGISFNKIFSAYLNTVKGKDLFTTNTGQRIETQFVREAVSRYAKNVGIKKVTPHLFRHYVGTKMSMDYGIQVAKDILDHSDINTTDKYFNFKSVADKVVL